MTDGKISPSLRAILEQDEHDNFREALVLLQTSDGDLQPISNATKFDILSSYMQGVNTTGRKFPLRPWLETNLPLLAVPVTSKTLEILEQLPSVEAVIHNQRIMSISPFVVAYEKPKVKKGRLTWGLELLQVKDFWAKAGKGKGIQIGLVDSGVYGNHPAISHAVKDFVFIDPLDRVIPIRTAFDFEQHGTHVAGTLVGKSWAKGMPIGVAPEAELHSVAINFGNSRISTAIKAVEVLAEKGVTVINMSWGFPRYEPRFENLFVEKIVNKYNLLLVAAIGNSGYGHIFQPANLPQVLSVGAFGLFEERISYVPDFSGGASFQSGQEIVLTKPDLVAPGVDIFSCVPTRDSDRDGILMSGTSMAAPHISGLAALLMASAKNGFRAQDLAQLLRETAAYPDSTKSAPDNQWGYGIIDPLEAYQKLHS